MRVLIADDHGIVRSGLRLLLESQPDIEVIAEAADGAEARELAIRERPDLAILDVQDAEADRPAGDAGDREQAPEVAVLILSMHDDERYLFEALKAGASGYVLKAQADTDLLAAIRAVERDEPFLTPEAQRALIKDVLERGSAGEEELTPREEEIVKLVAEANTTKEIAGDPPPLREDGREPPLKRDAEARDARPGRARPLRDPARPDRALSRPKRFA